MYPAQFRRQSGGVLKTHLTESQATGLLTDSGIRKLQRGGVLDASDLKFDVLADAASGEKNLIEKYGRNPSGRRFSGTASSGDNKRTVVIAALTIAAMSWMGKVFRE